MFSNKPYLIRAFYSWIVDNECTPYLLVNADFSDVQIPREYVQDSQIVLNISPVSVQDLMIKNESVSFVASFPGVEQQIYAPVSAVLGIYAKENGEGIMFEPEKDDGGSSKKKESKHPHLRLVE